MTRQELYKCIREERKNYPSLSTPIKCIYAFLCHDRDFFVYKYLRLLRYTEYYYLKKNKSSLYYIPYIIFKSKKNKLGSQLGIDMGECAFGPGLFIAHTDIIVGSAKIGKNCKLHGQNCIGSGATIGDNCELWVGAKVLGPAKLANGITVAAGAIVVDSFDDENITIGGVPARRLK
ncbi:MAG: hypothetical protein K6G24_10790 [Lachnospiraceae bacterium]|nr:hypothetical protein [Lachnospiraceae bacterium]